MPLKIFLRIARFLGKAILGLFLLLLAVLAIIHLPPVQKQITHSVSNYLSDKVRARVEITGIRFSITGHVTIHDIRVWDPADNKIFSAEEIAVSSSILDLLAGDLIFDEVSISGADGHLSQDELGLNIQYIIDAFQPAIKDTTTSSSALTLQFKKVSLENILFEFTSVSGVSVSVNLGNFISEGVEFSTLPTKIKADLFMVERTFVNTLLLSSADTSTMLTTKAGTLLSPDFGTGIILEIKNLELKDDDFAFHQDEVKQTPKFDPSHLSLKNIQLRLSDIILHQDTLGAHLQSLAVQLPGFSLTHAQSDLSLSRHQIGLSGLQLVSGENELNVTIIAPNTFTAKETDPIEFSAQGRLYPNDFSYFFSDSVMRAFSHWGLTELAAQARYTAGKGEINKLSLKTGNSQLQVKGLFRDVWDPEKISWSDMKADVSVGTDFKQLLTPFTKTIQLPPALTIHMKSHGQPDDITADAKIITTWGDVTATGHAARQLNNMDVTVNLTGEKVDLGKWLDVSLLGPVDLTAEAKGMIGNNQHVEINGFIHDIELLNQSIQHITFQSGISKDSAHVAIAIKDPNYRSVINSQISFDGPLMFSNSIQLDSFKLGKLLHLDSTLTLSGNTTSNIMMDASALESSVDGTDLSFQWQATQYLMDTLAFHALFSPTASDLEYYTDNQRGNVASNFDIREITDFIKTWSNTILTTRKDSHYALEARSLDFNIELETPIFFKLLDIPVDDFTSLRLHGAFDEEKQQSTLFATTENFQGFGLNLDTLNTVIGTIQDSVSMSTNIKNLIYKSVTLGNLDFDILRKGDSAVSNLLVANDSITLLGLRTHLLATDSALFVYPDKLKAFDLDYIIEPESFVSFANKNTAFNHFMIRHDDMQIMLHGDMNAFEATLRNLDLTRLNFFMSTDSIIHKGQLSSHISYARDQRLNLKANIDSLILYNSSPLSISATAEREDDRLPFEFLLTNTSNQIDLKGNYFTDNAEVDASLRMDINNLELFTFLLSGVMDEMKGAIKGEATIGGQLQKPELKGYLQFLNVGLTTSNPKLSFNVEDDRIELDNSGLQFNKFTLYDKEHHPLTLTGSITSKDYESFEYNLQINSDQYTLINNPDSTSGKIRGLLVLDSDIRLKGNNKDTNIAAKLSIKDATNLTFVTSGDDIELLKAEGIIDFVDPAIIADTTALEPSVNFYDSLIASLPDFNLNSTVTIEDNAAFRVLIDEQSGDYIEASGGASLELGYDRTGNLQLSGNYTIKKGVYRLSFYDLVKKNFNLVQGSSINWHGSPKNGDLSIKAVHTVKSNSIGLVGHEIGENEKSIYKRSLDYEVGINIIGTIEKPIISFSLDLPQGEKVNYPVLANKLDRLRQPEYESELNKQVFGLLVLGGFLPETSGADINSNLIATTALSNSVNSLLASQLNRFASQYIKGVNIDVGIQSFSDYSAPGGKTQTAMDFRVSKRVFDDRLSFEIGGDFNLNQDQSGANTGNKNYRGDIAIIYDLTGHGDKQLKLFNNETYDIVYQEIRNTGISLIFIREFERKKKEQKNP